MTSCVEVIVADSTPCTCVDTFGDTLQNPGPGNITTTNGVLVPPLGYYVQFPTGRTYATPDASPFFLEDSQAVDPAEPQDFVSQLLNIVPGTTNLSRVTFRAAVGTVWNGQQVTLRGDSFDTGALVIGNNSIYQEYALLSEIFINAVPLGIFVIDRNKLGHAVAPGQAEVQPLKLSGHLNINGLAPLNPGDAINCEMWLGFGRLDDSSGTTGIDGSAPDLAAAVIDPIVRATLED